MHQHFLHHKILLIYFGVCCFFAIKNKCTNICDKTIVMQKVLMQKMTLQKLIHQNLCGFIFAATIFVPKIFAQKIFV